MKPQPNQPLFEEGRSAKTGDGDAGVEFYVDREPYTGWWVERVEDRGGRRVRTLTRADVAHRKIEWLE
ncbi:MAG TPA: hypothetical protein VMV69_22175 [Pirellulales bacterium]|nr:hypothetical protein [Pirellulales bacterium]